MKHKRRGGIWLKITRFILLSVLVFILAVTVIITEASTSTSGMLVGLGILNIFNGAYLYKENKKTAAVMILSVGLFAIIVALLKFV